MSILPWNNFIKDCYIRLENLEIDGSIKELEEEWSLEGLESAKNTASKFVIYPKSKYDIEDYQNLKAVVYFGIEKLTSDDDGARVVKFYKDHIEDLDVYCVLNSTQTKFRLPVKMKLDENSSPLDGSPLFWKAEIEISKDFFGKDIYINPYIETNINKIFDRETMGIFSGGEIGKRTEFIRINFNDVEPPEGNDAEIEIRKVYFKEGIDFEDPKKVIKGIDLNAINEEVWVSTEPDGPEDRPFGYANMDLDHLRVMLEEGSSAIDSPLFEQIKKLKQKQITSSVWKTVCNAALLKLTAQYEKALDDESIEEDPSEYALDKLTDFEQAAVGYFCQKITSRSGSQNDRLSAIKEVLKKYFGDGEGVDLFNSLLAIEIDKKVGIKKYSNLVFEKSEELYENSFEDDEEIGDF